MILYFNPWRIVAGAFRDIFMGLKPACRDNHLIKSEQVFEAAG